MGRLKGKRVLVTGSANGIGRAAARLFAAEGAQLTLCDRDHPHNEEVAHEINRAGGRVQAIQTDVGEPDDMQNAVNAAVDAYGGLDVLYNNAGGATAKDGAVTDIELDEFWRTIRVDLFGTVLGCRFAIPHLVQAGGGSIINTTSIRAMIGTEGADAYTSAKGGIITLTRALALQWAKAGIRVNAIAPGVILTDRVRTMLRDDDPVRVKTPLGPSEPEDVAPLALYLASNESRQMTGMILPLDGGASAV
ncbi:MAG TPA: SDR family NAD(P)-dependent oxidoreductase [Arenicellales bacterium]|jgi:NAD(P)-dependent dehydrogenase (short-subunit alcohol dehydrogenase family)|nr:SDR family NAD(P)-dependent oxidoreductase [Arenicellales bacterium]